MKLKYFFVVVVLHKIPQNPVLSSVQTLVTNLNSEALSFKR